MDSPRHPRLIAAAQYSRVELQITRMKLALTTLGIARKIRDEATAQRIFDRASRTYFSILRSFANLNPTYKQQVQIDQLLGELRVQLGLEQRSVLFAPTPGEVQ
jgi:hypothetical protein